MVGDGALGDIKPTGDLDLAQALTQERCDLLAHRSLQMRLAGVNQGFYGLDRRRLRSSPQVVVNRGLGDIQTMCNRQRTDALLMESEYFSAETTHERMFASFSDGITVGRCVSMPSGSLALSRPILFAAA
jgi:hypothetical protein